MNKFLTFHIHERAGNRTRMSPSAYYIDADYDKVAVRIYAEKAPVNDAEFDIYDDGVSIFSNRTPVVYNLTSGVDETGVSVTYMVLPAGETTDEMADDFTEDAIAEGSWVYCDIISGGDGRNLTVQL